MAGSKQRAAIVDFHGKRTRAGHFDAGHVIGKGADPYASREDGVFKNPDAVLQKDQSITIPLMFNYGLDITDWLSAALAVGPTGSFAFGSQGVETKTFNLGIGSALVFTFAKHLALNAGYEYGFLNRYNGPASGSSLKTAKLNFGISYLF
ncbi:MAG: hypothetical protein IJ709_02035 [Selenomonas sp.]|nr:hypothetical protein [Selenomonas sp.]